MISNGLGNSMFGNTNQSAQAALAQQGGQLGHERLGQLTQAGHGLVRYMAWLEGTEQVGHDLQEQLREAELRCKMAAEEIEQIRTALRMLEAVNDTRREPVAR